MKSDHPMDMVIQYIFLDLTNKIALLPLNTIAHWSLVVVFANQNTIMMMDSMRTKTLTFEVLEILKNIQKHLKDITSRKFVVRLNTSVRQQTNSDDCGAFGKFTQISRRYKMII